MGPLYITYTLVNGKEGSISFLDRDIPENLRATVATTREYARIEATTMMNMITQAGDPYTTTWVRRNQVWERLP